MESADEAPQLIVSWSTELNCSMLHCSDRSRTAANELGNSVPLYTFRIFDGEQSVTSEPAVFFTDRDTAWVEMVKVCADLVGGIARNLKPDSDWYLELLDEAQKPLFRINLTAMSL